MADQEALKACRKAISLAKAAVTKKGVALTAARERAKQLEIDYHAAVEDVRAACLALDKLMPHCIQSRPGLCNERRVVILRKNKGLSLTVRGLGQPKGFTSRFSWDAGERCFIRYDGRRLSDVPAEFMPLE